MTGSRFSAPQFESIQNEVVFATSRSSGPGGQNVNKVNSKVILHWDVRNSNLITEDQKEIILAKLRTRVTKEDVLILSAQDSRSQLANKEEVIRKLDNLLRKAFTLRKKRKPTKPSKASIHKRVKEKKMKGEKKQWRQRPDH